MKSRIAVAILLVVMATSPMAWANEENVRFEWEAFDFSGDTLVYTVWYSNVAQGDSTYVGTVTDDGASDYAVMVYDLTGGEVYDFTVHGEIPSGAFDECTARIDIPMVSAGGCSCALIP